MRVHPEYSYWSPAWKAIRDCVVGEYEVKMQGQTYLKRLAGQDDEEYLAFLDRAYFYNMVSRTVNGLVGTVFRREVKINGVDKAIIDNLKKVTKNNSSATLFAKEIANEILTIGRYGVLLDMDKEGKNPPYLAGYIAENMVDWTVEDIDGRFVLTEIVLREIMPQTDTSDSSSSTFVANYRILKLVNGIYEQHIFDNAEEVPSKGTNSEVIITPKNLGKPFNFIPFVFFGPLTNGTAVEKSPILDIVLANLAHYQNSAALEHGRFYTALPMYHIQVKSEEEKRGSYTIGPAVVWEYTGDTPPGIAEYSGHGLKFLESGLDQKEQHIAALGGRMLGVRTSAVAESDNTIKLKEKNEQSLLLNVTTTVNIGYSMLLKWWSEWQGKDGSKIQVELNQDFLFTPLSAREFRAFVLMYKEGLLPIEVIYETLRKAEAIPEYMSLEEFRMKISDVANFPNNPDIAAKQEGFPDAAAKLKKTKEDADRKLEEKLGTLVPKTVPLNDKNKK